MNYNYIIDPITNKSYLITSRNGKQILKKFIKKYNQGTEYKGGMNLLTKVLDSNATKTVFKTGAIFLELKYFYNTILSYINKIKKNQNNSDDIIDLIGYIKTVFHPEFNPTTSRVLLTQISGSLKDILGLGSSSKIEKMGLNNTLEFIVVNTIVTRDYYDYTPEELKQ